MRLSWLTPVGFALQTIGRVAEWGREKTEQGYWATRQLALAAQDGKRLLGRSKVAVALAAATRERREAFAQTDTVQNVVKFAETVNNGAVFVGGMLAQLMLGYGFAAKQELGRLNSELKLEFVRRFCEMEVLGALLLRNVGKKQDR